MLCCFVLNHEDHPLSVFPDVCPHTSLNMRADVSRKLCLNVNFIPHTVRFHFIKGLSIGTHTHLRTPSAQDIVGHPQRAAPSQHHAGASKAQRTGFQSPPSTGYKSPPPPAPYPYCPGPSAGHPGNPSECPKRVKASGQQETVCK